MDLRGQEGGQGGYAMAALLVSLGVMSVLLGAALPAWRHQVQREKEVELIFRGEQYARAIALFQRKMGPTFPPNVDVLVEQRFLRRKYRDPITGDEFQILHQASLQQAIQAPVAEEREEDAAGAAAPQAPGVPARQPGQTGVGGPTGVGSGGAFGPQGGVAGVASKSREKSIILYKGRSRHNEWLFTATDFTGQPGTPGVSQPGMPPGQMGPPGAGQPGPRPPGLLTPHGPPTGQPDSSRPRRVPVVPPPGVP